MNSQPRSPDSIIEETASLWAARLEGGSLSAHDQAELDRWLETDPRHRSVLAEFCQLSADTEPLLPKLIAAGELDRPDPGRRKRTTPWSAWLGWGTATVAAAFAIVLWLSPASDLSPQGPIATAVAQRDALTLADGSRVELNARTSLQVDLGSAERRVRLASGQAFFQVSSDADRPFIVETPAGAVRVTGTAFDVRTLSNREIEVTVTEGSVQVNLGEQDDRPLAAPYQLRAGDQLVTDGPTTAVHTLNGAALADALAWRQGEIVFDETRLATVLSRFAHYHGRGIRAVSEAADLRLSGRFPLDDLDGLFTALETVLDVQIVRDQSGTVRVLPRQ